MIVSRSIRSRIALALCLAAIPAVARAQSAAADALVPATSLADSAYFAERASHVRKSAKRCTRFVSPAPHHGSTARSTTKCGRAPRARANYVQWDPDNGEPVSEQTTIQVAYDHRFIYVAIRCFDRTPD